MIRPNLVTTLIGIVLATGIAGAGFAFTREQEQMEIPVNIPVLDAPAFVEPISNARARVTKKPFEIHITPATSPVPNDKFNGYHVGVDFEVFSEEMESDVLISAMCAGPLLLKKFATGYGGVATQGCVIEGEEVTVIYGHLNVATIIPDVGDMLAPGDGIGLLGKDHSAETDGVRKHLHLGIRTGRTNDIRGYVKNLEESTNWLDPLNFIPKE